MIEAAVKAVVEEGRPYDLELEIVRATGVRQWVHMIGHPMRENGRVIQVRGRLQDITPQELAAPPRANQRGKKCVAIAFAMAVQPAILSHPHRHSNDESTGLREFADLPRSARATPA